MSGERKPKKGKKRVLEEVNLTEVLLFAEETSRKQGRFEGRAEGRQEAFQIVLRNLFFAGYGTEVMAAATGWPEAEVVQVMDELGLPLIKKIQEEREERERLAAEKAAATVVGTDAAEECKQNI